MLEPCTCVSVLITQQKTLIQYSFVGFEVLTEVVVKSTVFWDRTPCSPMKVSQYFGGTFPPFSWLKNKPSKIPV
jgi:hypothetical protein